MEFLVFAAPMIVWNLPRTDSLDTREKRPCIGKKSSVSQVSLSELN